MNFQNDGWHKYHLKAVTKLQTHPLVLKPCTLEMPATFQQRLVRQLYIFISKSKILVVFSSGIGHSIIHLSIGLSGDTFECKYFSRKRKRRKKPIWFPKCQHCFTIKNLFLLVNSYFCFDLQIILLVGARSGLGNPSKVFPIHVIRKWKYSSIFAFFPLLPTISPSILSLPFLAC